MSIYKIFPEKDTTLYSSYPLQNTGLDEILDISTTFIPDTPQVRRALIKFSTDEISNVINTIISGSVTDSTGSLLTSSREFKSNLKCYIAEIEGLNDDTTLEIYPLYDSWSMGTGKFLDDPISKTGCSWAYAFSPAVRWQTSSFHIGVTASFPELNPGGAAWYTASINDLEIKATQTISYSGDKDLNVDVTNAIRLINSGSINNEGFIIKQKDLNEFVSNKEKVVKLQYFSIDTNTIYPPQLEFKWRDYTFNTGSSSNTIINTSNLLATLDNNGQKFRKDSIHKFYINCKPKFPPRVFQTSSLYNTNYYLPTSSYYAIKDLSTNEFIIDFDVNYTQISADEQGSYFKLYMNGLEPERYYQILVKTEVEGSTLVLDNNYYFKIING